MSANTPFPCRSPASLLPDPSLLCVSKHSYATTALVHYRLIEVPQLIRFFKVCQPAQLENLKAQQKALCNAQVWPRPGVKALLTDWTSFLSFATPPPPCRHPSCLSASSFCPASQGVGTLTHRSHGSHNTRWLMGRSRTNDFQAALQNGSPLHQCEQ